MVEPVSTAMVAAAAGKAMQSAEDDDKNEKLRLLRRVLGPPADAVGESLGRWVEYRTRNVGRVLESADRKLGERANESGSVPIRVAAPILEEGSYCDEEVVVEYLGGVLASSRSGFSRDDRGTRWVKLITSLSTYEIRLHYILYSAARLALIKDESANIIWGNEQTYGDLRLVLDLQAVVRAMDFSGTEPLSQILTEAMFSLARTGLIGAGPWSITTLQALEESTGKDVPVETHGLLFSPSTTGVQLYMWAQGRGAVWEDFDNSELELPEIEVPSVPAHLVSTLAPRQVGQAPPITDVPDITD